MKRILFLLSASAVALAAPAGAAEVGVRHSWGNTTSSVHNGRSVTRSQSQGAFAERSFGASGGGRDIGSTTSGGGSGYVRGEVGSYSSRTRESFDFSSHSTTGFSESSTFSR